MKALIKSTLLALVCISSTQAVSGLIGLEGDEIDAAMIRTIESGSYGLGRICCYGLDGPFTVENGTADQQQYSSAFLLDVNDLSFDLDYTGLGGWQEGIVLSLMDLDFGNGSKYLSGLVIDTNVDGLTWDFGGDFINLNIGGTQQNPDLYIKGSFLVSNVPEPSALSLFLLTLPLLMINRRKKVDNS